MENVFILKPLSALEYPRSFEIEKVVDYGSLRGTYRLLCVEFVDLTSLMM